MLRGLVAGCWTLALSFVFPGTWEGRSTSLDGWMVQRIDDRRVWVQVADQQEDPWRSKRATSLGVVPSTLQATLFVPVV